MAESTGLQGHNKESVLKLTENFHKKRVLVIGDSILDANTFLRFSGKTLELPIPKYERDRTDFSYGGAGNVVKNILELGGKCTFITLVGDDSAAANYSLWQHDNLDLISVTEKNRKTTIKERFWVNHGEQNYPLLKINSLDNRQISLSAQQNALEKIAEVAEDSDMALLVDYRHGMLSGGLITQAKNLLKERNKKIIASSQVSETRSNHHEYRGVDLMCMNLKEAQLVGAYAGVRDSHTVLDHLSYLQNYLASTVCVTIGERGSVLCSKDSEIISPGIQVKEIDSCGAGDSFLAALCLCDYETSPKESLYLANIWAGLSVTKLGTEVPKKQELLEYLAKN